MAKRVAHRFLKQSRNASIWKVEVSKDIGWSDKINQNIFGKDGPNYELVEAANAHDAVSVFAAEHSLDPAYFRAQHFQG